MKYQPSRSVRKILRWFVNAEFVEEIEGDLDELFYERLSTRGWLNAQTLLLPRCVAGNTAVSAQKEGHKSWS